jgi:putative heme-binding domain-containing protein
MTDIRSNPWVQAAVTVTVLFAHTFSATTGAQSPGRQAPPGRDARASQATDGAVLFANTCSACHGEAGAGGVAPALRGAKFTESHVAEVVRTGRQGTMMPGFATTFSATQIQRVAAYVASLHSATAAAAAARPPGVYGDAAAGERLFFNATAVHSCFRCHSFRGRGGRVGPELSSRVSGLSPRELFERIVIVPHRGPDPQYVTSQLRTTGGLLIQGIRAGENGGDVLFYDASTLPPVLRVIRKAEIIEERRRAGTSVMPTDYAARLTLQQLVDLVAFLQKPGIERMPLESVLR